MRSCQPPAPRASYFATNFNFMQFLGKFGKIVCWCPPRRVGSPHPREILDPPMLTSLKFSSGSSGRVGEGPRNMKSMRLPLAAIFFMTNFYRDRGGMAPFPPWIRYCLNSSLRSLIISGDGSRIYQEGERQPQTGAIAYYLANTPRKWKKKLNW